MLRAICGGFLVMLSGCTGNIVTGTGPGDGIYGDPNSNTADPSSTTGSAPLRTDGVPSALRRLTRDELIATFRALTGSAPAREAIPPEPRVENQPLFTTGMRYIESELHDLDKVFGDFSTSIAGSMVAKSKCAGTGQAQRDCLASFSSSFGQLAMRRLLTATETTALKGLIAPADGTPSADARAMAGVLNAIFLSPSFLFRTEIGTAAADRPGMRTLTAVETANRLSFFATLGPPDAELLAAAASGELSDGEARVRQYERLMKTDTGKRAQVIFLLEWLNANEPKFASKGVAFKTGLAADHESATRSSFEKVIQDVLHGPQPTLNNLLTTEAYLNDPVVQAITKPTATAGDGSDLRRAGVLLHPHVLTAHTGEAGASPFRLGKFLREAILCEKVGGPPGDANDLADAVVVPPGSTIRETLEMKTSVGAVCSACHSQFAPLGFTLLPVDPVGRWLKQDPTGKQWNLTGMTSLYSGVDLTFDSPRELVDKLGSLPQVGSCFSQTALQWALGRVLVKEDAPYALSLEEVVKNTGGNVPAVFRALVTSPQFLTAVEARP